MMGGDMGARGRGCGEIREKPPNEGKQGARELWARGMPAPAELGLQAGRGPGARGLAPDSGALWDHVSFPLSLSWVNSWP